MQTKQEAFPLMFTEGKPQTIVVVPAINESTAADAPDYLNVTVSKPLANQGFYIVPVSIAADIFRDEGVVDGAQLKGLPPALFLETFGADAVLFITINKWDKNFYIIGSNVTVELEYLLLSTRTEEVLWAYKGAIVVSPQKSNSGNPIADLVANAISSAITTATTRYIDVAGRVHDSVLVTMPYGRYHPKAGKDGSMKTVATKQVSEALE